MRFFAFAMMLALALGGCGEAADTQQPKAAPAPPKREATPLDLLVRPSDNAKPIQVRTGSSFGVVLTANASTGHDWSVAEGPTFLRQMGWVYSEGEQEAQPRPGAESGKIFRFRATRPGRGRLRFARSYQGRPDREVTFEVVVD